RGRVELRVIGVDAAAGADDAALVEQVVGHAHRRSQQAAGIAAQVDHQSAQAAARLATQARDGAREVLAGLHLEGADAHVAIARLEHAAAHAGHADRLAPHRDLQRLRLALAYHAEYQAAARRAAQRTGALGVGRGQRATIHRDDDVAGPDAGLGRGR